MSERGLGDRWLAGELIDGVAYAQHAPVEVTAGAQAGRRGRIALLLATRPEPLFLVALDDGSGDARIRQSSLKPVE